MRKIETEKHADFIMNRSISRHKSLFNNLLGITFICLFALSCTPQINPNVLHGGRYNYRPGYPQVRFSAVSFLNKNNQTGIKVVGDIVYNSLIYTKNSGQLQSSIAVGIKIVSRKANDSFSKSKYYKIALIKKDFSKLNNLRTFQFEKKFPVLPGKYKMYLTVTDLFSDKTTTRIAHIYIPGTKNNTIRLTDIRMLGKDLDVENPAWLPISAYTVQGRMDSLKFVFQVTNNKSKKPLIITTELVRFKSDLSIARPLFYDDYSPSSLQFHGINYDKQILLAQSQRQLIQEGTITIELSFANQQRGNYRFKVTSTKNEDNLYKARDFGVKYKYYPVLKTPRALARPLAYLMEEDEYEELMSIEDPDSLKEAVDLFWLSHIGNAQEALQVSEKYYKRVVEANKQFATFKAGWKTDMGMIYILYGSPYDVDDGVGWMSWRYIVCDISFYQPHMESAFFPFQHWVVSRSRGYFYQTYRQRQLWLNGLISWWHE